MQPVTFFIIYHIILLMIILNASIFWKVISESCGPSLNYIIHAKMELDIFYHGKKGLAFINNNNNDIPRFFCAKFSKYFQWLRDWFKIMKIINNISPVMSHQGIEYYVATSSSHGARVHFVAVDPLFVIMKYFIRISNIFRTPPISGLERWRLL